MDAFMGCHTVDRSTNTVTRIEWPNGGNYEEQEQLVIDMFILIKEELNKVIQHG